jgi:cob(I)alamin adenosyltransferase
MWTKPNSAVGVALAMASLPDDVAALLVRIQHDLFDVGADLCTPIPAGGDDPATPALRVTPPTWSDLKRRATR